MRNLHRTWFTALAHLAALCVFPTGCPGTDVDPKNDAGPTPFDAAPVEAGNEASTNDGDCPPESYACLLCTRDDGTQFVAGGVGIREVVTDGDRVWFTDGSFNAFVEGKTTLFSVLTGKTQAAALASLDGYALDLGRQGGQLFWTTTEYGSLDPFTLGTAASMPATGGPPTTLVQDNVAGMVVTPSGMVVGRKDRIQLMSFDGTSSADLALRNNPFCPLAVSGQTLAWLDDDGCITLRTASLSGGQAEDVANVGYASLLAVDETNAYVLTLDGFLKVALAGGEITIIPTTASNVTFGVGGGWLYWTEWPSYNDVPTPVRRMRTTGGPVELVTSEEGIASVRLVDDTYVYLVESSQDGHLDCIKRKAH